MRLDPISLAEFHHLTPNLRCQFSSLDSVQHTHERLSALTKTPSKKDPPRLEILRDEIITSSCLDSLADFDEIAIRIDDMKLSHSPRFIF